MKLTHTHQLWQWHHPDNGKTQNNDWRTNMQHTNNGEDTRRNVLRYYKLEGSSQETVMSTAKFSKLMPIKCTTNRRIEHWNIWKMSNSDTK